jgi:hypothetical protein
MIYLNGRNPRIDPSETFHVIDTFIDENVFAVSVNTPWFADIANYLSTGKFAPQFSAKEKQKVIRKSAKYGLIGGDLFYTGENLNIHQCVREEEISDILKAYHDEPCGCHFSDKRIAYNILELGYFWPSIFKDT